MTRGAVRWQAKRRHGVSDRNVFKKRPVEQPTACGKQTMGSGCEQSGGTRRLAGEAGMRQRFTRADQVVENNGCLA
ncbi:hypothetical protein D3C76_568340 [compost metagenome]